MRASQSNWEAQPLATRMKPVIRLRGLLASRHSLLVETATRELGKNPQDVLSADIISLAEACKYLYRKASSILAPRRVTWGDTPWMFFGSKVRVERRARGVVGVIGTWNYPFFLAGTQMIQALAAGNTVVFKPSEMAGACAQVLGDLFREAGFDEDVLQILPPGREFGALLAGADVDHLVFTGSLPVGEKVALTAAQKMVTSTLELSGCDPLLALDDADPLLVARSAWFGAVANQGQTCVATRRIIGTKPLLTKIEKELEILSRGAGPFKLCQPAEVSKALELAREAVGQGARLLGEHGLEPCETGWCPPLVLAGATPAMRICQTSLFAPVLCLLEAETESQLVTMEKVCPLSLGASVFSGSIGRAEKVAFELRSPNIAINEVVIPAGHPATPIVARGLSGWGSTQGDEGLLEMTLPRVVYRGPQSPKALRPHLGMVPNGPSKPSDMSGVLEAMLEGDHHPSWWRRIRARLSLPAKGLAWWRQCRRGPNGVSCPAADPTP